MDGSEYREDAKHWDEENRSPWVQRFVAAHGLVRADFLRRIAPSIKKLSESKDDQLQKAAAGFIEFHVRVGLFYEREEILAALEANRSDEKALEKIIRGVENRVGVDPKISPEIWDILLRAKDHGLINAALGYPWLFCLPSFSADKQQFIERQLAAGDGRIWTNLNSALLQLALSVNPLAPEIIKALAESTIPSVRKDAVVYLEALRE